MTRVRQRGDGGFVLAEALVALTLLGMIMVLCTSLVDFGRRVSNLSRTRDHVSDLSSAADALAALVGRAVAVRERLDDGRQKVLFAGQDALLAFAAVSSAEGLPGGTVQVQMAFDRGASSLVLNVTPLPSNGSFSRPDGAANQVLLEHVARLEFAYFGAIAEGAAGTWHREWLAAEKLPKLVMIRVAIRNGGRVETLEIAAPIWAE